MSHVFYSLIIAQLYHFVKSFLSLFDIIVIYFL
nr:MAG TPA: CSTF-50, ISOFORM B-BINDING PROTEIN, 3' END MRNA.4A [Caudoviricetes sp.]